MESIVTICRAVTGNSAVPSWSQIDMILGTVVEFDKEMKVTDGTTVLASLWAVDSDVSERGKRFVEGTSKDRYGFAYWTLWIIENDNINATNENKETEMNIITLGAHVNIDKVIAKLNGIEIKCANCQINAPVGVGHPDYVHGLCEECLAKPVETISFTAAGKPEPMPVRKPAQPAEGPVVTFLSDWEDSPFHDGDQFTQGEAKCPICKSGFKFNPVTQETVCSNVEKCGARKANYYCVQCDELYKNCICTIKTLCITCGTCAVETAGSECEECVGISSMKAEQAYFDMMDLHTNWDPFSDN